jgi:hypothetical protein
MQQYVEQQINAAPLLKSLRPAANGLANALACFKGYSAIQASQSLRLTCRIAPFRDGDSIVQTTSAFIGRCATFLSCFKDRARRNSSYV